jgi:hypothetical protein
MGRHGAKLASRAVRVTLCSEAPAPMVGVYWLGLRWEGRLPGPEKPLHEPLELVLHPPDFEHTFGRSRRWVTSNRQLMNGRSKISRPCPVPIWPTSWSNSTPSSTSWSCNGPARLDHFSQWTGRKTKVIPPAMRRAVIARDRHCQHPGCFRPSKWCDIDHKIHWLYGGETKLSNLQLLCPHNHTLKHRSVR